LTPHWSPSAPRGNSRVTRWFASMPLATMVSVVAALGSVPDPAAAQAWVPPAGTGSIGMAVQRIDHTGHRVTDGTLIKDGRSLNVSVDVNVEYALTNRLVVSGGIPFVFGRFTDPNPPPPFIPFLPIDQCRCWNSGAQDFNVTARYNLFNGAFALTPSVSAVVPSHDYDYRGEAVIGRDLKELSVAISAGQRLDAISDRLTVQGTYMYAVVERVLDIPNNRSNGRLGVSVRVQPRLFVEGELFLQRTHGGLRIGSPPPAALLPPGEVNTPERLAQHDRLLRDNSTHVGATVTYLLPKVDVFGSYRAFVSGTDAHAGRAWTTGISWPFDLRH